MIRLITVTWIVLALLFVSITDCTGQPVQKVASQGAAWCWAAAIECSADFYGNDLTQCGIVYFCCLHGNNYINKPVDKGCCCCASSNPCDNYCPNHYGKVMDILDDITFLYSPHLQEQGNKITLAELEQHTFLDIAMASFEHGHLVVIYNADDVNDTWIQL